HGLFSPLPVGPQELPDVGPGWEDLSFEVDVAQRVLDAAFQGLGLPEVSRLQAPVVLPAPEPEHDAVDAGTRVAVDRRHGAPRVCRHDRPTWRQHSYRIVTSRSAISKKGLRRFGRKPLCHKVPETGLEPARPVKVTRPSTWRVCQ